MQTNDKPAYPKPKRKANNQQEQQKTIGATPTEQTNKQTNKPAYPKPKRKANNQQQQQKHNKTKIKRKIVSKSK